MTFNEIWNKLTAINHHTEWKRMRDGETTRNARVALQWLRTEELVYWRDYANSNEWYSHPDLPK